MAQLKIEDARLAAERKPHGLPCRLGTGPGQQAFLPGGGLTETGASRMAPPSPPGKGKWIQLSWNQAASAKISKNTTGKRKDKGEVEKSQGAG